MGQAVQAGLGLVSVVREGGKMKIPLDPPVADQSGYYTGLL